MTLTGALEVAQTLADLSNKTHYVLKQTSVGIEYLPRNRLPTAEEKEGNGSYWQPRLELVCEVKSKYDKL